MELPFTLFFLGQAIGILLGIIVALLVIPYVIISTLRTIYHR